jgi:hypothetical protein
VGSFGDWDWRAELAQVSAPVLTIHGDHDALALEGASPHFSPAGYSGRR